MFFSIGMPLSANNFLFADTVSANNYFFADTLSANNLFPKGYEKLCGLPMKFELL